MTFLLPRWASTKTHSAPFAALAQVVVSSQRRRRVPVGPAVGGLWGPNRARVGPNGRQTRASGGRRGSRCFWQHGPRVSGARGAFGGQWCRREAASRAPLALLWPFAISLARDSRRWSRCMPPRQLRAGWGWPGGGPWSPRGRTHRRGRVCGAVVVARTRSCAYMPDLGIFEIVRDCTCGNGLGWASERVVCSFYMFPMMCDAKYRVCRAREATRYQ